MKTIGLIGGMSPESTVLYYNIINHVVNDTLGGLHSAKCVLYSVDFQEIEECQAGGQWHCAGEMLAKAAVSLQAAGADFLVLCTNTMHKVAPEIEAAVDIPLLHIADVTAAALTAEGIKKVALLGTKYTMEQDFYTSRLAQHGIRTLLPDPPERTLINDVIYNELCRGKINKRSRAAFLSIIQRLAGNEETSRPSHFAGGGTRSAFSPAGENTGAQGAILGCTEIGLLVQQKDTPVPLFDTTWLHAKAAALRATE